MKNSFFIYLILLSIIFLSCNGEAEKHEEDFTHFTIEEINNHFTDETDILDELVARGEYRKIVVSGFSDSLDFDTVMIKGQSGLLSEVPIDTLKEAIDQRKKAFYQNNLLEIEQVVSSEKKNRSYGVFSIFKRNELNKNEDGEGLMFANIGLNRIRKRLNICSTESASWLDQVGVSHCTGFAVSRNVIATAGHCLNQFNYKDFVFVLNYKLNSDGDLNSTFDNSDLYYAVEAQLIPGLDLTIVKLDRKISKSSVPQFISQDPSVGAGLYMFGHPFGAPLKASLSGILSENNNSIYYKAEIDAFIGNSGSPVFEDRTNRLVGLLYEGQQDLSFTLYENLSTGCRNLVFCNRTSRKCSGEKVLKINLIRDALRKMGW